MSDDRIAAPPGEQMDLHLLDCCAELGLTGHVDATRVKAAYRAQVMQWHPDRHHADAAMYAVALEKTTKLNLAYECLTEALEDGESLGVVTPDSRTGAQARAEREPARPRHSYRGRSFTPGFPDATVFEVFVKSSNILSAGYSSTARVMYIKFHDGGVYRYFGVPTSVFDAFLAANSHGSFAHSNIYGRFRYERC